MKSVFIATWLWSDGYDFDEGILGVYTEKRLAKARVEAYLEENLGKEDDAFVREEVLWGFYGDMK
jgi:hypothetical protein